VIKSAAIRALLFRSTSHPGPVRVPFPGFDANFVSLSRKTMSLSPKIDPFHAGERHVSLCLFGRPNMKKSGFQFMGVSRLDTGYRYGLVMGMSGFYVGEILILKGSPSVSMSTADGNPGKIQGSLRRVN
jgi:hypothetical protein